MQRIEKAFFKDYTPPGKKHPKNTAKKIKIITISILVILALIPAAIYFISNFDFTLLISSKETAEIPQGAVPILGKGVSEVLIENTAAAKLSNDSSIQFKASKINPATLTLNLKIPVDATKKSLVLTISKIGRAELEAIFRDNRFVSNSLNPIKVKIDDTSSNLNYTKVIIPIPENIEDIDWTKITQIRLNFNPQENIEKLVSMKNIYLTPNGATRTKVRGY